jgi:hypothetical protein
MAYLLLNFELFLTFLSFLSCLSLCESLLVGSPVVKHAVSSGLSIDPSFARFLVRRSCCNLWHRVCCSVCCHERRIRCRVFCVLDCAFFFALCFLFRGFFWRAFCRFEKLVKCSLSFAFCLFWHIDVRKCSNVCNLQSTIPYENISILRGTLSPRAPWPTARRVV